MAGSTPARLYCTLLGAALVIAGILGFFYSASFDTGASEVAADQDEIFGLFAVNGWHDLALLVLGLAALALAGSATGARAYSLGFGLLYVVVAIWGFVDADGVLLGLFPINDANAVAYLLIGLLGLGAGAATPTVESRARRVSGASDKRTSSPRRRSRPA